MSEVLALCKNTYVLSQVKAIGVSNFEKEHIEALLEHAEVVNDKQMALSATCCPPGATRCASIRVPSVLRSKGLAAGARHAAVVCSVRAMCLVAAVQGLQHDIYIVRVAQRQGSPGAHLTLHISRALTPQAVE